MNNYILIAVSVIVIILLIGYSCRTCGKNEYFHDYEARFSKEGQVQGFLGSSPNFRITELSNPSDNKYVLEQFNFDTKGFRTSVSLEPNSNYTITYWRANDDLYNAKNYDIEFYNGDSKVDTEGHVVCNKIINGLRWKKVKYNIRNSFSTLNVIFGAVGSFTKGVRYYADFRITKSYPKLKKFKYYDDLKSFYLFADNSSNKKQVNDLTERHTINFVNELNYDSYGAALNKINGSFSSGSDIFSDKNTIIFTYTPEENQNGSLLSAHAINDSNVGINIDFQTSLGVENYMSITLSDKNYIYNIGLITNPIIFALVINNSEPELYVNNHKTKPIRTNKPSKKKLGSCPDGFRAVISDGSLRCQDVSNIMPAISSCKKTSNIYKFSRYDDNDKLEWAKKCGVSWKNCKSLNDFEVAPSGDSTCGINSELLYSNKPVEINKDKTLTGRLHNLIIYNANLSEEILTDIYKYIIVNMIKLKSEDNCCSRPSLIKESTPSFSKQLCPFEKTDVCEHKSCSCVDWGDKDNLKDINGECKDVVNSHCKNNSSDRFCNKLRELKNLKSKVPKTKVPDSLTKAPVINNIANCDGCTSKVDLTKYIKKDKIPCWGCNLDDVDKKETGSCGPKIL